MCVCVCEVCIKRCHEEELKCGSGLSGSLVGAGGQKGTDETK